MIFVIYGGQFLKSAQRLPLLQQKKLAKLISLLRENPFHPLLHTKPLTRELAGLYSFRITREWRVIFQFLESDYIRLLLVGHRRDIYK